jgi:hypothetical protein
MRNFIYSFQRASPTSILTALWGCAMLPLWSLGIYQALKEENIFVQGLVMSSAAVGVALCFVVAPIARSRAAWFALFCTAMFAVANVGYNQHSLAQLGIGFVFTFAFFLAPTLLLLRATTVSGLDRQVTTANLASRTHKWRFVVATLLILLAIAVLYGLGSS